ncbi:MAG: hypothetical protein HOW73_36715 [Polyangiaceae bacterium]|nr:hypothetical protein [Polyangiaceae bacterium]
MGVRASRLRTVGLLAGVLVACKPPPAPPLPPTPDPPGTSAGLKARYSAVLEEGNILSVQVDATDGAFSRLTIESGAEVFLSELEAGPAGEATTPVAKLRWPLDLPVCKSACTVKYRFDLGRVAEAFQNPQWAERHDDAILAPATTWLVRPIQPGEGSFELAVDVPSGHSFVSGLRRGDDGVYRARLDDLPQAPYAAFGRFDVRTIRLGKREVEWVRIGNAPQIGDDPLEGWVTRAAQDVASYFGKFPTERALVIVLVEPGRAITEGTALGNGGASIIVHVGENIKGTALAGDWILTHEMVHLSMPGLASRHRWMEEGFATYIEPVARAQMGRLPPDEVWAEWYNGMRKGQPLDGEGGLDGTDRWGRIYWGGAAFWLMAEVAIAQETDGKKGLRDCLRAVVAEGGTIDKRWSVRKFLGVCDAIVGKPVVQGLYDQVASEAVEIDLESLFSRLGVRKSLLGIVLDDKAPEALVRKSILAPARADVPRPARL